MRGVPDCVADCVWLAVPQPTERQRNRKSDQSRDDLLLGIAACGDTSEMLDDALSEIDVQDAEHFVGELGPTFPVVESTSESTPQPQRQCAARPTANTESQSEVGDESEKLTF
jgi:hypothetical protein